MVAGRAAEGDALPLRWIECPTANKEHPISIGSGGLGRWMFLVGFWRRGQNIGMFLVGFWLTWGWGIREDVGMSLIRLVMGRVAGGFGWAAAIGVMVVLAAGPVALATEERPRAWTNKDGKSVTGTLKEKGDGWVKILIKSRLHKIPVDTLSEEDREYIGEAKLYKTLRMRVTTVRAESSNAERGLDIRKIKVVLENVQDRKLKFRLVWIAQASGHKTYGPHRTVRAEYDADGEYFHKEKFYRNSEHGVQYKGYAVRLTDEKGNTVAETASLVPLLRFLDEKPES